MVENVFGAFWGAFFLFVVFLCEKFKSHGLLRHRERHKFEILQKPSCLHLRATQSEICCDLKIYILGWIPVLIFFFSQMTQISIVRWMCNQGQSDLGLLHAVLCQSFRKTWRNALEEEQGVLEVIEWPPHSPDLNIIQCVWDHNKETNGFEPADNHRKAAITSPRHLEQSPCPVPSKTVCKWIYPVLKLIPNIDWIWISRLFWHFVNWVKKKCKIPGKNFLTVLCVEINWIWIGPSAGASEVKADQKQIRYSPALRVMRHLHAPRL